MENLHALRGELREKFFALVKSSATEDRFIEFITNSLQRSNKLDIKALEVILDLTLAVIDPVEGLDYNCYSNSKNNVINKSDQPPDVGADEQAPSSTAAATAGAEPTLYDADDEGLEETFIFPCHIIFDDCHPELLFDYHRDHLKTSRTATQIVKHPKLCEFVVDFMFRGLASQFNYGSSKSTPKSHHPLTLSFTAGLPFSDLRNEDEGSPPIEAESELVTYLESTIVIIKRLNKICSTEKKNCRILSRTNILDILMENILFLLQETPDRQHLYLEPLLKFALTLADYKITGPSLKQLFSIIKNENADLKIVLSSFERLLNHHCKIFKNIQPIKSINFPTASRTPEEIESNSYISNSWHWRLRSKVIDTKRKRSRSIDSQSNLKIKSRSRGDDDDEVFGGEPESSTHLDERQRQQQQQQQGPPSSLTDKIVPSWLECSIIAPSSNISPLIHNGEVSFCCSMWMSVCGDLLVVDETRSKKAAEDLENHQRTDWRVGNGHWLRLTSRRRLARRYKDRIRHKKSSRLRRMSGRLKKRQADDEEDEQGEDDEHDESTTKQRSNLGLNRTYSQQAHLFGLKFNHQSLDRSVKSGESAPITKRTPVAIGSYMNNLSRPPKEFLGRRARDNSQELLVHLVSFAFDALTIEIWLNVKCMTFCARACRIIREGQTNLLDQVTFPSHLEANGNWSHIMFCLEEINKPSTHEKVMNLKVIMNGVQKEKERLIYSAHKSPLTNFACLIGCERSTFGYVWKLSQINIFKSSPPKDIPMFLLGKGPDFWGFTNFRQKSTLPLPDITQRSVRNLMNPKMLNLYRTIDEERALNWLTQNILISYVAHQPDYFLDYSSSMTTPSLMNPLPADHEFSNSAERFIQAKVLNFSRSLRFNTNHGFGSALVEAGGIESVLICFADVIRRANETSQIHSLAFSVLLKMSQTNQHHLNKFLDELNGLKLAEFILVHPDCVVSKPMLDYYFEFCLMRRGEYGLIRSPKLLYHLLSCWRAWHKDVRVAKLLYRRLVRLLQPTDLLRRSHGERRHLEGHYMNHNFVMMTQAGGMDILLGILRECLVPLDENVPKINHDLVELIVNLISLLIKHPPGLDVMLDIMEFLLFLHPDPKAYVEVTSDKISFLHVLKSKNLETMIYDGATSRLRTPLSETSSYRSSMDNLAHNNIHGSELNNESRADCSLATSSKSLSNDEISERNNIEESGEYSEGLTKFINQYNNVESQQRLSSIMTGDIFPWGPDDADTGDIQNKTTHSMVGHFKATDEPDTSVVQKCSNRNFAIANIADMLASIVKLSLTDPRKILSDALQKSIIDPRKLIILANNNSSLVREKVLRLFLYCIRACYTLNLRPVLSKYEQEFRGSTFRACVPIQLMARQLLKYPTTIKMIQLCYGIIVGIDDFETVESVCPVFNIETIDNNLQLNTLILLIQLMTQLQTPKEIVSTLRFVHAYVKQLLQLGEDDILSVLVKNNLVDCLMRIYFAYVEHKIDSGAACENYLDQADEENDDYSEVLKELDKTLILVVRYFIQNLSTGETIRSIEDLMMYFDLVNSYVPPKSQCIIRDRQVKVLTTAINYCERYEDYGRQKCFGGRMEYYLRSLFKNSDINMFPNVLSDSQLDLDAMLNDNVTSSNEDFSGIPSSSTQNGREHTVEDRDEFFNSDSNNGDEFYGSIFTDSRRISENNVIDRFKATLEFAVDFITTRDPGVIPSPLERRFIIKCVKVLSSYLTEYHLLTKGHFRDSNQRCQWHLMLPKLERCIRTNFTRSILYLLSPCDSMNLDERKYYASKLLEMFTVDQLINLLSDSSKTTYKVLIVFIRDLIDYQNSSIDSEDEDEDSDALLNDDTEAKLKLLARGIGQELSLAGMGQKSNGYLDRSKRAKISDESTLPIDTKFRDIWMADLSQAREEAKERLRQLKIENQTFNVGPGDGLADDSFRILDEALKTTRDVVNDKHEQRKAYLEDLKQNKVYDYHLRQQWLSLIIGHTHERAIWFMKDYYPRSWELNPVEGPSRIRRRLRPCKLMLDPKYLRQTITRNEEYSCFADKMDKTSSGTSQNDVVADDWYNQYSPHPLCSMVINHEQPIDSNELRIRMFTTDKIHFNCDCSIIRPNEVCDGEVSIASWCIHFIGVRSDGHTLHLNDYTSAPKETINRQQQATTTDTTVDDSGYEGGKTVTSTTTTTEQLSPSKTKPNKTSLQQARNTIYHSTIVEDLWFDEIVEVWDRRYQLQDVGLEIFLTNNMTYLISFRTNQDREDFKQSLMKEQHKMINLQRFNLTTSLNKLTQLWRDGRLTNFDYLTCLNKLAGRSFNDLMQYPVFPFVLSNYSANVLDLNQASNFRILKKPMAIQNQEKEATFINNYLVSQTTSLSVGPCGMTKPYHYGNHYSNSATVLHFLVRLPPFTQMLIQYQDNNFDQPDRTFHSIASTWQLITRDSNTDFKELIPEFFFLPEMFTNFEQFELGRKQNNELVDDVKLPSWCPNHDARLFTLIHRQALESAFVSENLHDWIDLIFGCRQTGKAAVDAINVFHPATYYGMIDLSSQNSSLNSLSTPVTSSSSIPAKSSSSVLSSIYISNADAIANHQSTTGNASEAGPSTNHPMYQNKRQQANIERLALETMIKTYGQMPRQLFAQPVKQRSFVTYASPSNLSQLNQQDSNTKRIEPLRQVKGLKWGSYVGSPAEGDITAVKHKQITSLRPTPSRRRRGLRGQTSGQENLKFNLCLLPNGEIALLKENTSLMLDYRADRKSSGGQQVALPSARYSRRAGFNVARMNQFSNMIISRQQFGYIEPSSLTAGQFDSANTTSSSLVSLTSSRAKFSPDSLSLISWSYLDGTIRIRHPALNTLKMNVPLVQADSIVDTMSACASVPELNLLLVGYKSGSICAHIVSTFHESAPIALYNQAPTTPSQSTAAISSSSASPSDVHFLHTTSSSSSSSSDGSSQGLGKSPTGEPYTTIPLASKTTLQSVRSIKKTTRWLYCHSKRINCMRINVSFGIVVTGSDDGTSVIWDLNSLTYIRTIDYKVTSLRNNNRPRENSKQHERTPEQNLGHAGDLWNIADNRLLDYLCNCDLSDRQFPSTSHPRSVGNSIDTGIKYDGGGGSNCNLKEQQDSCVCSSGISLIAISDTLGDIVSIKDINCRLALTDDGDGDNVSRSNLSTASTASTQNDEHSVSSILYVHTINGALVGFVNCHAQVTAVCYSNAPEGISVNVIVVGLADGLIRLYSSWDLSRVKEFHVSGLSLPITSLLYSRDSQLLYIAYEDGQLVVLRNKKKSSIALPKEWFL